MIEILIISQDKLDLERKAYIQRRMIPLSAQPILKPRGNRDWS